MHIASDDLRCSAAVSKAEFPGTVAPCFDLFCYFLVDWEGSQILYSFSPAAVILLDSESISS